MTPSEPLVPRRGLAALVSPAAWRTLTALGVPVRFCRDQILFHQGDTDRHAYVILSGTVKVIRSEADGRQTMLTVRSEGDVVGDMAALDGRPRSATVTATTPVVARFITAAHFRRFVATDSIYGAFMQYTLARFREADELRAELALLPVRTRLARTLLRLARSSADHDQVGTVNLSQQEIAQIVGASRNAVVAELAALRDDGTIVTRRGVVIIRNITTLIRLSNT